MRKLIKTNLTKICQSCDALLRNPYARLIRLHSPLPILLLLLPCLWAITIKSTSWQQCLWLSFIFTIGSILTRSAGCVINDIWDKEIDTKVARTKNRPLAAGQISKANALKVFLCLLAISALLLFFLPYPAIIIAFVAAAMMGIYPLAKRFTHYPQVFLGITYNLGIVIAWLSAGGTWGYQIATLYIACIFWTIGYDAIYAFQDLKEDLATGVKSIAVKFANKPKEHIWRLYQIAAILIAINGLLANMHLSFFIVMAVAAYQLYWQTEYTNFNDPSSCQRAFNSNIIFGLLVFLAFLIGKW